MEYLKEIFAYPFYFKIMRKYGFSVILKTHNTLKISDCLSQENLKKNNFIHEAVIDKTLTKYLFLRQRFILYLIHKPNG